MKKKLILVRGLPGSGKSTKALQLVNGVHDQVCENDYYYIMNKREKVSYGQYIGGKQRIFETIGMTFGTYKYDAKYKSHAGWWCFYEAFRSVQIYDTVAVANVFAKKEQLIGYINEAKKFGIDVEIVNMPNISVEESFKRNVHKCSKESIQKMYSEFEVFTQADCDAIIGNVAAESR